MTSFFSSFVQPVHADDEVSHASDRILKRKPIDRLFLLLLKTPKDSGDSDDSKAKEGGDDKEGGSEESEGGDDESGGDEEQAEEEEEEVSLSLEDSTVLTKMA